MIKKLFLAAAIAFGGAVCAQAQEDAEIQAMIDAMPVHAGDQAPDFTLKDINGQDVSLSSFKGKWAVLDFWGSWCRFCIQGIPDMKEAYAKYHDKGLEIVGIDCNEPEEAWKAAVEKYSLPWVNLYNPGQRGEGVCKLYGVVAYPTKILIDPEGKVSKIYLGEDPAFYEFLESIF